MIELRDHAEWAAGVMLEITEGKKITKDHLWDVMRFWKGSHNTERKTVTPDGQDWVESDTVGLVSEKTGKAHVSRMAKKYPNVTKLLNKYFSQETEDDDFRWTSVTINSDFASKRHRDRSNQGPSAILALGHFTGGQLKVWKDDDRSGGVASLNAEDAVEIDPREISYFDGRQAHETCEFKGRRVSMIWYTARNANTIHRTMKSELRKLGFRLPTVSKGKIVGPARTNGVTQTTKKKVNPTFNAEAVATLLMENMKPKPAVTANGRGDAIGVAPAPCDVPRVGKSISPSAIKGGGTLGAAPNKIPVPKTSKPVEFEPGASFHEGHKDSAFAKRRAEHEDKGVTSQAKPWVSQLAAWRNAKEVANEMGTYCPFEWFVLEMPDGGGFVFDDDPKTKVPNSGHTGSRVMEKGGIDRIKALRKRDYWFFTVPKDRGAIDIISWIRERIDQEDRAYPSKTVVLDDVDKWLLDTGGEPAYG